VLGKSSIEAYGFFIIASSYVVMSAFGVSVNVWAGLGMSLFMLLAAGHLLWSSIWTYNWNRLAKVFGTVILIFTFLVVVNEGYSHSRITRDPNIQTLSAIQNLTNLVKAIPQSQPTEVQQSTHVYEIDGKYPQIELSEPREVTPQGGVTLINLDEKNVGGATAFAKRESAGLFIAPEGIASENAVFHFLNLRDRDRGDDIPSEDLAPNAGGIIPIGGPAQHIDGSPATDQDRRGLYERTNVLFIALLVSYQDRNGRVYRKELCYYTHGGGELNRKCTRHNGHG
jgi:hypothetical protein